jgi:L-threonylcarbamoyladenylate synthase
VARRQPANEPGAIEEAARILGQGGLVAFPTETVYGLGADATNAAAVAKLYAAKGRPAFNPLIAHVANMAAARALARFDAAAEMLAAVFWPGPLTLVLARSDSCPVAELATAGLDTIAVRVPAHPVARALLGRLGKPVVAPSANRSGHVSPTTADHVLVDLAERIKFVLDGGPTPVGVESTILACPGDHIVLLRPGGVPREAIERALGRRVTAWRPAATADPTPLSPGMLASHYAPRAALRLDANAVYPGEALLAFGPSLPPGADHAALALNLSAKGDVVEAAANLFSHLRALDREGVAAIAVMPIPYEGLGEAINDRLARAAAPRA